MTIVLLYLVVFAGGVLTILSPCILPVLPFVFARTGRGFARDTVPMLGGMALAFCVVALSATAGAAWVARTADVGRWVALVIVAAAGVSLLWPRLAETVSAPFVRVGAQVSLSRHATKPAPWWRAAIFGAATGVLWAPCAGPILGLVFGSAIVGGDPTRAATLFAVFAFGATSALAVALTIGARARALVARTGAADIWVRRALGTATLAAVGLIALGLDAKVFAGGGLIQTASAETRLLRSIPNETRRALSQPAANAVVATPDRGPFPGFDGGTGWIGSVPLSVTSLKGKVVFVDFWTFECYNCQNALPYVKALHAKYQAKGLVVVGVHTPEFPRERVKDNVVSAMARLGVTYPVVTDNGFAIWKSYNNEFWPAAYIVDKHGRIRYYWAGEGKYDEQERVVQQLLAEP